MIRKKFPIHNNRSIHTIPISSIHKCSPSCKYRYIQTLDDDLNLILSIEESTDQCPYKNTTTQGYIKLATFNEDSPTCINGALSLPNTLVIRENCIKIVIDYPLTSTYTDEIHSPCEEGFRLSSLVKIIADRYRQIYAEEEETCSEETHTLTIPCKYCSCVSVYKHDVDPSVEDCTICCQELSDGACKTPCNHIFHKDCIVRWSRHGTSCPVCREPLSVCKTCNGTRKETIQWTGKVVPSEYRIFQPRNTTNGRWGIHTADFESLVLAGLQYSQKDKTLYLSMSK